MLFICVLSSLSLSSFDAGASKVEKKEQQQPGQKRVLILGDSLTEGYGVAKQDAFPAVLENLLNDKKNDRKKEKKFKVLAAGSSGSTTASAYKRLKWHLKNKPDLLIIALGGNDGLRGLKPEASKANLEKAVMFAKSKGVKISLAGMKIPMNYGKDYRASFEKIYTDLVKKHELEFIPFLLKGVGGVKKLNLPDGIHPNEEGHKIIGQTLYKHVREIL